MELRRSPAEKKHDVGERYVDTRASFSAKKTKLIPEGQREGKRKPRDT